jgi:hypothetical protein
MIKTVIIVGVIGVVLIAATLVVGFLGHGTVQAEYVEFFLALALFASVIVGSYHFVVRGPGRYM